MHNLTSKLQKLLGVEIEKEAPKEIVIRDGKLGKVFKDTKTGVHYHKVESY